MTHQHLPSCGCCQNVTATSTVQTLQELDFERGIWSAALNGEIQKIREYLNKDGDPNVVDSSGYFALHYAARSGHVDICRLLLNHGACPNACTRSGNVTPLHRAAYSGQIEVVRLLLERKASVCHQDADGKTALHKAVEMGHLECARVLVADDSKAVGIVDWKGKAAKDFAPLHNIAVWDSLLQTKPS